MIYKVHATQVIDIMVRVEADSPEDAIDQAEMPAGICAHCSGWGRPWSRNDSSEHEIISVLDTNGNSLWPKEDE